jgi:hypothetical protein
MAVLLLDGNVFPLSPFNSTTLLNSRHIVCRKHSTTYSRFVGLDLSVYLHNYIAQYMILVCQY